MKLKSLLILLFAFSYVASTHAGIDSDIPSSPDASEKYVFYLVSGKLGWQLGMHDCSPVTIQQIPKNTELPGTVLLLNVTTLTVHCYPAGFKITPARGGMVIVV